MASWKSASCASSVVTPPNVACTSTTASGAGGTSSGIWITSTEVIVASGVCGVAS
jgi:hypothetical protein